MTSRHFLGAGSGFALGLLLRAAAIVASGFCALHLLATHRYYATATVLFAVTALLAVNLVKHVHRADILLDQIVSGLLAGDALQPRSARSGSTGLRRFTGGLLKLVEAAAETRHRQQQRLDFLEALIDNVPAALFVIAQESLQPFNRAARKLMAEASQAQEAQAPRPFMDAVHLTGLSVGERKIVRLSNAKRALIGAVGFSGASEQRLVSVQFIESELDLVELEAWQNLVRILAHEIMNSLTPISSLAASIKPRIEALCGQTGTAENRLATAQEACTASDIIARRSLALIDFVARYRKVMELPRPQMKPISLRELFTHVEHLMSPTLKQKSIDFSTTVNPAKLTLDVDVELLQQALINLLYNAIDAVADMSSPQIAVHGTDRDSQVEISVADNGIGIDPKLAEQIFVPFFTTKSNGAGIGLSLVHKIVLAHQGRIEVNKNALRGSVFTIRLPQHRDR